MFDRHHYVPILKSKLGELWALRQLPAACKEKVTPLFELDNIPKPRKPSTKPTKKPAKRKRKPKPPATLATHLESKCRSLAKSWGTSRPFFVDLCWIKNATPEAVHATYEAMRSASLKAIPVIRVTNDTAILEAVADDIAKDKRGAMLRVTPSHLSTPHLIAATLSTLGVKPSQVHFLLDYGASSMSLERDLSIIPTLLSWATLSAASAAFPPSLKDYPHKEWRDVPRLDVMSWKKGLRGDARRFPSFSDYTVRAPGAPPTGGNPPVVVRYTCGKKWIVRQDGYHMEGDSPEMQTICKSLVRRDEYCGEHFSAGDREFQRIADGSTTTGGPTTWLQCAVNHHVEFVVAKDIT